MGANILSNVLGNKENKCEITAACCICGCTDSTKLQSSIETSANGLWNNILGKNVNSIYLRHEKALKDHFKEHLGIDMLDVIHNQPPSLINTDTKIVAPQFGFQSIQEYYDKTQCKYVMHNISTPTLFFNALDDPIVNRHLIGHNAFKKNKNLLLATTEHGGHLGYH